MVYGMSKVGGENGTGRSGDTRKHDRLLYTGTTRVSIGSPSGGARFWEVCGCVLCFHRARWQGCCFQLTTIDISKTCFQLPIDYIYVYQLFISYSS